jgi:cyclic pyranopterin phosphate synthase
MQANGRADTFFEQIFPKYTEIADQFRKFLRDVGEDKPMAFLVDIPLCTTEGIADFNRGYVEKYRHFDLASQAPLPEASLGARAQGGGGEGLVLVTREDLDHAEREKRAECRRCRYNGSCEGVWKNYLKRYGWDEMIPVTDAPPLTTA